MFEPKYQNASKKSKGNMVFSQRKTMKRGSRREKWRLVQKIIYNAPSKSVSKQERNFYMRFAPFLFTCASTLLIGMEKRQPEEPAQPSPPERAILAPARPAPSAKKDEEGTFYGKLSAIVWQGKLWGLEFAEKSYTGTHLGTNSISFNEKLYVPDFAWVGGGKLDLGCQLPYDGWDLNTRYTYYSDHFTSKKKRFDSLISPAGVGIVPLWYYPFYQASTGGGGDPIRYALAKANWKFYFNSIDLELGRYFFVSQFLPIRTTIGLKGAWMHHHYHANYENGTTIHVTRIREVDTRDLQLVNSRFAYGQHSWALGPRISFDSKWPIWGGLSLIGNGGLSLLYSFFKTTTEFNDTAIESGGELEEPIVQTPSLHRKENFHELDPVLEAQLGFDWGMMWTYRKRHPYAFAVTLAYEWQYWWSQNHVRRGYAPSSPGTTWDARGDLQMHGLTGTLRFDF